MTQLCLHMAANFLASNLPANFGEAAEGLRCAPECELRACANEGAEGGCVRTRPSHCVTVSAA